MTKFACRLWRGGEPCDRKATHDIQYTRIREMDAEGKPAFDLKNGMPRWHPGPMQIIPGGYACKRHATKWAARLDEQQEDRKQRTAR